MIKIYNLSFGKTGKVITRAAIVVKEKMSLALKNKSTASASTFIYQQGTIMW